MKKLVMIAIATLSALMIGSLLCTQVGATTDESTTTTLTATCAVSGGIDTFKYPIGIEDSTSSYVAPSINRGQTITIKQMLLVCTSSGITGSIEGVASGEVRISNATQSAAAFYSCTNFNGLVPTAGGTLSGRLTIDWVGELEGEPLHPSTSVVHFHSLNIGTISIGGTYYGNFTFPGGPGGVSVTGAFAGSDHGASSTMTNESQSPWSILDDACNSSTGLGTLRLGQGTAVFG
jgi:hypothetical protein